MSEPPPLMLCMEKDGEEVALQIHPTDDFRVFLVKAKALLGYDVDLNSITHNQPVSLNDNIYQFLLNYDQSITTELSKPILPSVNTEDLYILDDGTQIRASQIHFDNEDPLVDLTAENIPFVKCADAVDEPELDDNVEVENKLYNIVESPVRSKDVGNNLVIPFKLVNNNPTDFEKQFTKYLEVNHQIKTYATLNTVTNRDKSPRSLIRENFKNYDDDFQRNTEDYTQYTREDILNMFKDAPVPSKPYENQGFLEKRRHARKSDPSRLVPKSFSRTKSCVDIDGVLIAESESRNCLICSKYIDNNHEKLYIFDNEDQRIHRSSPQKKVSSTTQLKIICESCLEANFRPCRKSPNQSLSPEEYLVIQNNQQYIFQKINNLNFDINKKFAELKANYNRSDYYNDTNMPNIDLESDELESQGQPRKDVGVVLKTEQNDSSSDVEIIENGNEFDDIDNLEEADEEVIEFLGKYQSENSEMMELKCRFCDLMFKEIAEVIDHGQVHKHVMEDGTVFPCPLCEYGYANFKWLKGHLKAAHERVKVIKSEENVDGKADEADNKAAPNKESSPIASRTRSAAKTVDAKDDQQVKEEDPSAEKTENAPPAVTDSEPKFEIKTEVKQETLDSSDEEIWIVQAADEEEQVKNAKHQCSLCRQLFVSEESKAAHKCRRRGRRKSSKEDEAVRVPSQEDFMKRAQGRSWIMSDSGDKDLLIVRPRRKKNKEPSSDPQVVTCHNCNESFTSKVRLKFHMQFHDKTNMLTPDGNYVCAECKNTTFTTETALFDHVHFQHHKQRRWQCPVPECGKTFYLRATLTKHSRTHTDTRRYVCGTCGKRFLDKQTLDEHGVTHLQIKPFQCHICLKQLTRRSRLRMHLRAHEEELCPRLVLVCAVCSRAFRDSEHVQEHLTQSPECLEEFTNELKEEEAVTEQLSPTSGLVRHAVQVVELPKLSKPISREASGPEAEALLSTVPDGARPIIRCLEIEKAFRCEFCEDVFYSESGLNNHRTIHKGVKNPFTCHICKVRFATYSRCTTHKTTHGFYKRSLAMAKQQQDNSCNKLAGPSSTGILGYGDFPVVKHFLCEDCGRSYLHWTYLQVHRRMKHASENLLYKCAQCELSFSNSWSLSYHRKKQHGKPETDDNGLNRPKEREDYRIPCRDCDEVLPNKTALYKHRKKEHSDLSLQINNDCPPVDGVFWCGGCGRRYSSRAGLEAHYKQQSCAPLPSTHHPSTMTASLSSPAAVCAKCTNTFPDVASLHAHLKTCHGHELDYTCSICKKAFCSRSELSVHARTHCPRRVHTCTHCGHAFRTLSMLTEHARVHSGERPYPCDVCGVAFRRSTAMRNHRLIHSGVRAWACARCPKRFRIRSDLRTHLRLKHPARLYVIEVAGTNPTPEEVMERLTQNNIPHDKVIEITKMIFLKGVTSIIPNSARALEMLAHIPRTPVACTRRAHVAAGDALAHTYTPAHSAPLVGLNRDIHVDLYQPARRGRGIAKNPRKPKILQRGGNMPSSEPTLSYTINVPMTPAQPLQIPVQPGPLYSGAPALCAGVPAVTCSSAVTPAGYPMPVNVTEDLSTLNVQLFLGDGENPVRLQTQHNNVQQL